MCFESEYIINHSSYSYPGWSRSCSPQGLPSAMGLAQGRVKKGDIAYVNNYRAVSLLPDSFKFLKKCQLVLVRGPRGGSLYPSIIDSERSERGVRARRCGRLFTASPEYRFESMTISCAVPCRGGAPRTVGSGWFRGRGHQGSDVVGVPLLTVKWQ